MFIAHLPAAYIALRAFSPRHPLSRPTTVAALLGGVAPDLDLAWFYLVDARQHHHHDYLTHRPALWAGAFLLCLLLAHRTSRARPLAAFFGAALLHLALDSVTGRIAWAWPLSDTASPLIVIPALHPQWQLNFLTHWSFLIEPAICLLAATLMIHKRKTRDAQVPGSSIS